VTRNGVDSELRTALAGALRIVPFASSMVLMVILWGACGGGLFKKVTSSPSPTSSSTIISSGSPSPTSSSTITPSSSPSPTSTSTNTPGAGAGFLYVPENGTGQVSQYSRNASTGALNFIGKISAGAANGPVGLGTAASSSRYIYVANSATTGNVYEYSIDNVSGVLTRLNGNPVVAAAPQWIAVTPNGSYVYVTNSTGGSVSQYTVSSGVLKANSPSNIVTNLSEPYGAAANNDFLFVTDRGNFDVIIFPIDGINGTLETPTSIALQAGGVLGPIAMDPGENFAFATDTQLGLVYVFTITRSGLTMVGSYPTASVGTDASVGVAAVSTLPEDLEFIYIANPASNSITQYEVSSGTGVLTSLKQYVSFNLDKPWGVATATDSASHNSYLYVTNAGNGEIAVFTINPSSGELTAKGTISTGSSNSLPLFPLMAH
jgi:6-phosphogluconolactonase